MISILLLNFYIDYRNIFQNYFHNIFLIITHTFRVLINILLYIYRCSKLIPYISITYKKFLEINLEICNTFFFFIIISFITVILYKSKIMLCLESYTFLYFLFRVSRLFLCFIYLFLEVMLYLLLYRGH